MIAVPRFSGGSTAASVGAVTTVVSAQAQHRSVASVADACGAALARLSL